MHTIQFKNNKWKSLTGLIIFLQACLFADAQQALPPVSLKNTTLRVPAFLPGIMNDPSASLQNDTLIYNINAQVFPKGLPVKPGKAYKNAVTPWETLAEMIDAYNKKDKKRIIALYTSGSQQKISDILNGDQSVAFLDYVNKATGSNLRIMGGMDYQNGFMAYSKDDVYGLHENFMTIENKMVKLTSLNDQSVTSWNIGLYFKFEPGPMIPLKNLSIPDSLGVSDSIKLRVTLPDKGRWIAIFKNEPDGPVPLLVQDNGIHDSDPVMGLVSFQFKGSIFTAPGEFEFYAASFNFPVQRVSKNFFTGHAPYRIKIN